MTVTSRAFSFSLSFISSVLPSAAGICVRVGKYVMAEAAVAAAAAFSSTRRLAAAFSTYIIVIRQGKNMKAIGSYGCNGSATVLTLFLITLSRPFSFFMTAFLVFSTASLWKTEVKVKLMI